MAPEGQEPLSSGEVAGMAAGMQVGATKTVLKSRQLGAKKAHRKWHEFLNSKALSK